MTDMDAAHAEILAEYGVTEIGENKYAVTGSTGNMYTVSYVGCGDCGEGLWECDCPAGKHGRNCKHLTRAINCFRELANLHGWE